MMKKLITLGLLPIILAGCNNKTPSNEYTKLRYVSPTGAPAVAMASFAVANDFATVSDPSKILPMMVSNQVDVAVLPTNVGAKAIVDNNVPFKMLATITFGNFYIASTGKDDNNEMDSSDYIVSFQQGAVPDKIFHYVHGDTLDLALHYVSSAQAAAQCLKLGKNLADDNKDVDYVLLAEPALTTVKSSTPSVEIYEDLQSKYKEQSGGLILPQASVFVSNKLEKKTIDDIYNSLSVSISEMLANPDVIGTYMNAIDGPSDVFGVAPEMAVAVTKNNNRMGIDCKSASSIKEDINEFLTIFGVNEIKDENIAK